MFCTKLHYLAFASTYSTGNFETIMFTIILIKINKSHKFTQGTWRTSIETLYKSLNCWKWGTTIHYDIIILIILQSCKMTVAM